VSSQRRLETRRQVLPILQDAGHRAVAVQQPLSSIADDVAKVRGVLDELGTPVVVVGHSFGGVVITQAAHNAANVSALVYVAAFAPDEGETCPDVDPVEARVMAAVQGPSDAARFGFVSGPPAWREHRTHYVVAENDQIIPPDLERFMAERRRPGRSAAIVPRCDRCTIWSAVRGGCSRPASPAAG
jgi:pimeloyl-ACP methyl ester carboxylesterase